MREMRPADVVEIRLEDGRPVCEPHYAQFGLKSLLQWSFDGDWAIHFLDKRTPTGELDIRGHGRQVDEGRNVAIAEGHYRYAVAVRPRESGPGMRSPGVYIDATCPEIIIGYA